MLHQKSFEALRKGYAAGEFSPVEVLESAILHAHRINETTNAFAHIDAEFAVILACASAERWRKGAPLSPLDGVPMSVKDTAAVKGWPTLRGSRLGTTTPVEKSSSYVDRLLAAGVVLFAKTRAPEFNWKGVTDSPAFGITRNPWDLNLTPGGSSGGCAAAVAAGVVRVSLGSDAGGSVRIPAAFTGTIGLKPTFGRIPMAPLPSAFCNVVNTGPIAACTADLAEVMRVVAGADPMDWTSVGLQPAHYDAGASLTRLRVGILKCSRWSESESVVKQGMAEALDVLAAGDFEVVEVDYDVSAASDGLPPKSWTVLRCRLSLVLNRAQAI